MSIRDFIDSIHISINIVDRDDKLYITSEHIGEQELFTIKHVPELNCIITFVRDNMDLFQPPCSYVLK